MTTHLRPPGDPFSPMTACGLPRSTRAVALLAKLATCKRCRKVYEARKRGGRGNP